MYIINHWPVIQQKSIDIMFPLIGRISVKQRSVYQSILRRAPTIF